MYNKRIFQMFSWLTENERMNLRYNKLLHCKQTNRIQTWGTQRTCIGTKTTRDMVAWSPLHNCIESTWTQPLVMNLGVQELAFRSRLSSKTFGAMWKTLVSRQRSSPGVERWWGSGRIVAKLRMELWTITSCRGESSGLLFQETRSWCPKLLENALLGL